MMRSSLSGIASIAGVRPDGPGPIRAANVTQRAVTVGLEVEAPRRARVVDIADRPRERAPRLALDDRRRGRPRPDRVVLVVALEAGAEGDALCAADPLGAGELRREPGRQVDVAHEQPHVVADARDALRHLDRRPVGVFHSNQTSRWGGRARSVRPTRTCARRSSRAGSRR